MKFGLFYDLKGPFKTVYEVPSKFNPVKAESLKEVLENLIEKLPNNPEIGLECIGLKIICVEGDK